MDAGPTCSECGKPNGRLKSPHCSPQCAERVKKRRQRAERRNVLATMPRCVIDEQPSDDEDLDPEILAMVYDHERWRCLPRSAASSRSARDLRERRRPGVPYHPDFDT